MTRIALRITIFVFVLCAIHAVSAQDLTNRITPTASAPVITGTASGERLRFTAPNSVVQIQLQIYADSGQMLFDVTSKGNVLDWTLQDSGGEHLVPGSYLCVVTVKSLSGKLSQRIGSALVQERQVELQRVDATQFTAAQQQAVGPIEENGGLTILKAGEPEATTVLANDGKDGQLIRGRGALSFRIGDFFSGTDQEQMRLTEEGNLGIGTDSPQAKLDVAGMIRTSKGIEIANPTDGTKVTTLTTTATGSLQQTLADGTVVANVTGTGTQNQVAKWTDSAGTLGDSTITEVGGKVGIGVTNPSYKLVVGPDIGPGLTTSDLTISRGPGQSVSIFAGATGAHGMNFGWDEANQRAFVNAPVQSPITFTHGGVSERMRIETSGNVGIGTPSPASKLDVAGNINTSTQYNIGGSRVLSTAGSSNVFAGVGAGSNNANIPSAGYNNAFFGKDAGFTNTNGNFNSFSGYQAGFNNTGHVNSFFGANAGCFNTIGGFNSFFGGDAGNSNTTESYNTFIGRAADGAAGITNATAIGNAAKVTQSNSLVLGSINGAGLADADTSVGIGTTAPAFRLHVVDPSNAGLRVQTNTSGGTVASFASKGDFQIDAPSLPGGRFVVKEAGNVGIGTSAPEQTLHVNGASEILSTGGGAGFKFRDRGSTSSADDWVWYSNGNVARFFRPGIGDMLTFTTGGVMTLNNLGAAGSTSLCRNASNQISTCSSSLRYKTNIASFSSGLNLIKRLRPITFDWKDGGMHDLGLGAEDVATIDPLLVTYNAKGEVEGVKYDRVGVVLVNAVQEQQRQIEAQQKQIEQQRKQIDSLTKIVCEINSKADICRP